LYDVCPMFFKVNLVEYSESENNNSDSDGSKTHRANRNFTRNHAMAIHLNAIAMIATVVYGFSLSATLVEGM
jgi:hypothetical protein